MIAVVKKLPERTSVGLLRRFIYQECVTVETSFRMAEHHPITFLKIRPVGQRDLACLLEKGCWGIWVQIRRLMQTRFPCATHRLLHVW